MSAAQVGRHVVSDETRAKLSAARRRRKLTPEAKRKIAAAHRGTKRTDEQRRRISEAHKGLKPSPEAARKAAIMFAKTYTVVDPEGNVITLTNLRAFCRERDLKFPGMLNMIKGRRSQYKGWRLPA